MTVPRPTTCCFEINSRAALFEFLLRVVRDVDKAEIDFAVTLIIVQSYAEDLETDILEQGLIRKSWTKISTFYW